MLVDELKIFAKAGKGGNGVVRWRQEKGKPLCGPGGGDGGNGGNIYVLAVRDIGLLAKYRHQKDFLAENGGDGGNFGLHGKNGNDYIIELPIGSIVKNLNNNDEFQLLTEGQKEIILKGGRGGYGNEHFKASTNTTPKESTPGKVGEEAELSIELQIIADVGFVGLPNAGKSSLLNELTSAKAKIGAYPFTTLDPNLGDFYGFILADIPGLIEGASEGRGLGIKFLRHIKRTKILVHLISFENEDLWKSYTDIRKEIENYSQELIQKNEIIILTKTDLVTEAKIKKTVAVFKKHKKENIFTLSLYDDNSLKIFKDEFVKILRSLN